MAHKFGFVKPKNWTNLPFNEKIRYYGKILNSDYAPYVDKLEAKKIVKEMCGEEVETAKVIKILNSPSDLLQEDLNINHIIKGAHASKFNVNIKESTKLDETINKLEEWNIQYYPLIEKQYSYLTPRFFIEEKVDDFYTGKSGDAVTFMIRCIYGKPVSIGIWYQGMMNNHYLDWKPIQTEIPFKIPKPVVMPRMLELASKLSAPFEFVRIDFYISKDSKIYFSEFTFTPQRGARVFPKLVEKELGMTWI